MTVWGLQDQLAEVIDMLLDRHPMGLRVLTGEAPPPTQEDIHLMYQAARVGEDPGVRVGNPGTPPSHRMDQVLVDEQNFNKIVERSGGWEHIAFALKEFAEAYPKTWAIVEDHVTWVVGRSFSRLDEPQIDRIASMYGVSRDTVMRYRRNFPLDVAVTILRCRPSSSYSQQKASCNR